MDNIRDALINSICQQKIYWLSEYTANPDVRIVLTPHDRCELLRASHVTEFKSNYGVDCELKEEFCGCELAIDPKMEQGKYRLEIIVDYHVVRVVKLTI